MGATAFDRWLGTPSTLCFLRRLLAATGNANHYSLIPKRSGPIWHIRPYSDVASLESSRYEAPSATKARSRHSTANVPGNVAFEAEQSTVSHADIAERASRALWEHAEVAARRKQAQPGLDHHESRQNIRTWIDTIERRQRLDGFAGIHDVWKGMRYRGIDLPVIGPEADILWPMLLGACITAKFEKEQDNIRESILQHAKDLYTRSGALYPGLHRLVVGRAIQFKNKKLTLRWHEDFIKDFGASNIDLRLLAIDFARTLHSPDGKRNFSAIYKSSNQRNLYDPFMTALLLTGDDRFALRWHRIFMKHGDGPSAEMLATEAVQRMFRLDEDKSLPMLHRRPADLASPSIQGLQFPTLTRASMSTMVGEAHGIKPKEVSDTFVAKLFATSAFPLDMVLKGLGFFSIEELGPLALHELAIRSGSRDELVQRLHDLKLAGIEVGPSVYGQVLQKIAHDGPDELFDSFLASDQHPEAYDDLKLQGRLLAAFLAEGDLPRAHLALTALASGGESSNAAAWNVMLQHHVKAGQYRSIVLTLQQMQLAGVTVNNHTLVLMREHLLPPRALGRAPVHVEPSETENIRPLQVMTNVCMYAAQHETSVHHSIWVELLKRYGMMHRWDELENLVRWLVSWYSSRPNATRRARRLAEPSQLRLIFTGQMLQAIVTWGFNNAAERRLLGNKGTGARRLTVHGHCETWAQGVMLLKQLSSQGLYIAPGTVRNALLNRLWILFGPAWSLKASNEQYKEENELSLAHYVQHADEIWDRKLFDIRPELLQDTPGSTAKLMLAIFGPTRREAQVRS
ncbi:hypothetical protein CLAFUW4_05548 [Fulvia fulva]|uniref:Pentatricopeptide repeat domain-containing protein n=1 Tax=Passalora fulva TaxID=5499 RepID=A0A9Q8LJK1_PASFU|nr:uncharacterized protein CLAFUR5_05690 [Fulvia fulva]KAK4624160.1 hypothetical protein CLAFUR4_05542 [Fulvia fulva]KAK4625560.1 hypothetical protein CLAFUR0_05551 [Fulvia fulva]UJO17813.1 hypothetical protein CLAFUR5_05690 [Fulvia fulva]WPV15617.1 hypothetical protein CLAFUW4_05548 [Fulvia fulva]WPV30042.1 hypothetical protein CLAFUW7_05546 [Fulvia fulva]